MYLAYEINIVKNVCRNFRDISHQHTCPYGSTIKCTIKWIVKYTKWVIKRFYNSGVVEDEKSKIYSGDIPLQKNTDLIVASVVIEPEM